MGAPLRAIDAVGRLENRDITRHVNRLLTRITCFGLKLIAIGCGHARMKPLQRAVNRTSHRLVFAYLRRYHRGLIDAYRSAPLLSPASRPGARIAWVAWWQGEEVAPKLVKLCLASLRRNLGDIELRVVTELNFREYSDLSPALLARLERGQISLTQFSDALRFNLVRRHGGIWIDATVLTPQPVTCELFDRPFYSRKANPAADFYFVSQNRWSGFLIGGSPDNAVFGFVNDLIEEYWAQNHAPVNYFLIDYALALAYEENIGGFREMVDELKTNNPDLYALAHQLQSPFDARAFAAISPPKSPTWFYKLNWRLPVTESVNGRPTVYGHLRQICMK